MQRKKCGTLFLGFASGFLLSCQPKPSSRPVVPLDKPAVVPEAFNALPPPATTASATTSSSQMSPPQSTSCPPDIAALTSKTLAHGYVFDDQHRPMEGVKIQLSSLHPCFLDSVVMLSDKQGHYYFPQFTAGINFEMKATKAGYAFRHQTGILKANKSMTFDINQYDFGTDGPMWSSHGEAYNALSDKPEVVTAIPGRNTTGVAANTPIRLGFSEPMTIASVEENFQVQPVEKVSGDKQVWSKEDFDVSWNSDKTEVTFAFKPVHALSTSLVDNPMPPKYRVSLNRLNGILADATGVERKSAPFNLTDGNFELEYTFSLAPSQKE